ncbi:MAG: ABC transporter substrate-binding protein [Desulfobacterales bacterium]|nr:ABC transporter substrate-binding protein [Desulfobacterales bacterium]
MRKRKLFIAAVMAVILMIPLAGMSADLKVGLKSEPSSMDPHYHNIGPNVMLSIHVFDQLIKQDHKQNLKPGLAVSWEPVNDLTWELKLRKGVKFHDGSPFTAKDVEFTMKRIPKVPNSPSPFTRFTSHIKKTEIIDPHTIRFSTKEPFPLMATYLSTFSVISKKYGESANTKDYNSGKAMIGTGPYKFVEWVPGDRVVYKRNNDYWGEKEPWKTVTFKPLSNSSARVAALLAGDVDIVDFLPTPDIERLEKNPDFTISKSVSNRVIYLHIDSDRDVSPFVTDKNGKPMKKNPLKDVRVRRAISKAINRDAIVSKVMEGNAIAAGQLLPDGFFAISPKLKPEKYDPKGAKKLLADAGWPEGFGLTIHGPNNRYVNDAKICQAIAQMLTRVGIKTKVDTMPKNVFFPRGTKLEFSLLLVGWGSETGEPSSPLGALLHTYDRDKSYGQTNRGRYSNKKMDETLEEALRTVDREKHKQLLIKATEIAMDDLGIIPLHYQVSIWAMKKGLSYTARTDAYTLAMGIRKAK